MPGRTVTTKLFVAVLPERSVALQVMVVLPIGNSEPDAGSHETGTTRSIASYADALKVTTAVLPL